MSFSTRYIDEYQTELRLDLKDGSTLWSNGELTRSVERAVADLDRFYPLEAVYEHTIVQTVTEETWNSAAAAGTYVSLANKPIFPGSETVTDSSGNACTRDTDYTIDYVNGKITHISGGEIDNSESSCVISYEKDKVGIDISAIISNLVRIVHVIYPHDQVPMQSVAYSIWNSFMWIGSQQPGESQTYLNDAKHIMIYYEKPHTAPAAAAAPTYPAFLDQVVCIGAGAYALLTKALQYEHQAVTDIAYVDTALDKVATYLETNGTTDCAIDVLANITDDKADLRTAIATAVDAANAYLDDVDTTDLGQATVGAEAMLASGDDYINAVNLGAEVPQQYANFARARMEIGQTRVQAAIGYIQEATQRIDNIRTYIEEAGGWCRIAEDFIAEGTARIQNAEQYLSISDRFRAEGERRMAEFQRVLEDRAQHRKRIASIPTVQPTSGGPIRVRSDRLSA